MQKCRADVTLWDDGVIYYVIGENESNTFQALVRRAMDIWENDTCIYFMKLHKSIRHIFVHHVVFTSEKTGCYSDSVGRKGSTIRRQVVNIDPEQCGSDLNAILHLIGHALGFWHEKLPLDLTPSYAVVRTFTTNDYRY